MVKTICKKCGYKWNYKGKLMRRTCPNCGYNWIVKRGRPIKSYNENIKETKTEFDTDLNDKI